jgi:hypothetical protein
MKVNARGDLLDDSNKIISPKNKQISRQVKREVKFNEDSNNNM